MNHCVNCRHFEPGHSSCLRAVKIGSPFQALDANGAPGQLKVAPSFGCIEWQSAQGNDLVGNFRLYLRDGSSIDSPIRFRQGPHMEIETEGVAIDYPEGAEAIEPLFFEVWYKGIVLLSGQMTGPIKPGDSIRL